MNGMDLFSGIGGISKALEQWVKPVIYCEIDTYCQGVLLSRMADESISDGPIWDDITTLSGCPFNGSIDIIYGGFPCQDISIAGNGKGLAGERSGLFFEILRLAKEIRPPFIFLENVPAITVRGGLRVVREIAEMGYDCRWCVISAESVGAPHKRDRWFLLAHANSKPSREANKISESIQNTKKTWLRSSRQNRRDLSKSYWEENKCPVFGMDDGLSYELGRAKSMGNSVVPEQAKEAFQILMGIK